MKHFVIAGTHYQFELYRKRKLRQNVALKPSDVILPSDIVFVSGANSLRGYRNPSGVFIGTWRDRNDLDDIFFQLISSTVSLSPSYHTINKLWDDWKVEVDKRKTYIQNVNLCAEILANEIDKQVLNSLMKYTP